MKNKVILNVTITFEDEIKNPSAVVEAVKDALVSWVQSSEIGLGGENDTFTNKIEVSAIDTEDKIISKTWEV